MQTVKHVLEDLARFNPEARMEPEIEIGSISPVTECNVTIPESEDEEEKMGKEYADLEEENSDLKKELDGHEKLWEEVTDVLSDGSLSAGELAGRIRDIAFKADNLTDRA